MANFLRLCTSTARSVMVFTILVYFAIVIPLLIIHETVPAAPSDPVRFNGLNLTEAWLDLSELTNGFHPYNSKRNDEIHDWLLRRIEGILADNDIDWETGKAGSIPRKFSVDMDDEKTESEKPFPGFIVVESGEMLVAKKAAQEDELRKRDDSPLVTIFNDLQSNVTASALGGRQADGRGRIPGQTVYFEGNNIIVYIRGTEDEEGKWWESDLSMMKKVHGQGGVLVNNHFDSVSTGFGATDDGVGVITTLQLIRYFTTTGNRPKKGIVALFNNGEEDFLNGARAYTQHPMSLFTHTFLNLEGAGAGGRAVLFRSTDTEITKAYAKSPHPFGTVLAADGFKQGLIASQTDYVVFEEVLGLRGLDVAFWEPRARYHTNQDDAKHTSVHSLWHMLSSSVATVKKLASDTSKEFNGPRGDKARGKVHNGRGSTGVWFDLFSKSFAVFGLKALFAWSLTFLICCPLAIILVIYLLVQKDKFYFFSTNTEHGNSGEDGELVHIGGWKGAFRWPLALVVSSALTFGTGLLVAKFNPLIIYSSQYAIWIMMVTLKFSVFWFIMRGADFARPSALTRGYAYMWMFVLGWILLVVATVGEDRYDISAGYLVVFYEIAIFFALIISLLEQFLLPTKAAYAESAHAVHTNVAANSALPDSDQQIAPAPEESSRAPNGDGPNEPAPTEGTPLLSGDGADDQDHDEPRLTTFANYARRSLGGQSSIEPPQGQVDGQSPPFQSHFRRLSSMFIDAENRPYGNEQAWSGKLPRWTWLIQFMVIAPFMIIILGQAALLAVTAINQTGPDGSSLILPFMVVGAFTIFILLPITPTIHRFTHHIPVFLFLVFIGTLIYNLVAFPFSSSNRYKAYFQQTVDLDTGSNEVVFAGLEEFIRPIIDSIPSAAGQHIDCKYRSTGRRVKYCSYVGIPPVVVPLDVKVPPETQYKDWLSYNVSRESRTNTAMFTILGKNTKACSIRFDRPVKSVSVHGAGHDDRFEAVPEGGSKEVKLWHRNWDEEWKVDVEWPVSEGKGLGDEGMEGRVVCLWSDWNTQGAIPALDEAKRFAPTWVGISKLSDGLVEGSKAFNI